MSGLQPSAELFRGSERKLLNLEKKECKGMMSLKRPAAGGESCRAGFYFASMEKDSDAFSTKLRSCPRDELYLITPAYLTPYLSYIKNNKRLFRTATAKCGGVWGMDKSYERMFRHVFTPILDRYGVLQQDRPYIMAFYIRGLMAIISEWLKNDCADSITYVTGVIQQCVKMPQSETMKF